MREELRTHRPLAELAARQYGVVSVADLRRLGYSTSAVGRAVATGRLHRIHRGVYLVGYQLATRKSRCIAAALAYGDDALLSHSSAAWLWGLVPTYPGHVEVTVPRRCRNRGSIRVHFVSDSDP